MMVDIATVSSVYSGIDGRCCCGCSGKYTYAKQHQAWSSKDRGYEVTDDEVSDRVVKMMVNKMNKLFETGYKVEFQESSFVSVVKGSRVYMARFITEQTRAERFRTENKATDPCDDLNVDECDEIDRKMVQP